MGVLIGFVVCLILQFCTCGFLVLFCECLILLVFCVLCLFYVLLAWRWCRSLFVVLVWWLLFILVLWLGWVGFYCCWLGVVCFPIVLLWLVGGLDLICFVLL